MSQQLIPFPTPLPLPSQIGTFLNLGDHLPLWSSAEGLHLVWPAIRVHP